MTSVVVNRAPVLTLWAAIVAERLGYDRACALTLGKAIAGLNAQSKGRRLGLYEAPPVKPPAAKAPRGTRPAPRLVPLLGRMVPLVKTPNGLRAMIKERSEEPAAVERYLVQKFGPHLQAVETAMWRLANAYPPKRLATCGFALYEEFRPDIPEGVKGWGAKGRLDLGLLAKLGPSRG